MSVSGSRSTLILLTFMVCALSLNAPAATKSKHPKAPVKQQQPVPAPAIVEVPPTAELTPEQMPAVAPHVTYQNRQLTIVAENSTLGDILRAVRAQTGATIDLPPNANARVVAHIGPGPSRDVLATLLNGTLFNYVLVGTVSDPSAVGKILLTQKPTGAGTESAANVQPNMMQQQNSYPMANVPAQAGDEQEPDTETSEVNNDEQPPADQAEQPVPGAPNGQQPNLRTPEQLLQELQRQQQLQQQMQQQGNPPTGQVPEQNPQQ